MKTKLLFAVGILLLFISACSSVSVNYDYDKEADFTNYSTYKWLHTKSVDSVDVEYSLDYNVVRSVVDLNLISKGFVKKSGGETDFLVIAYSGVYEKIKSSPWGNWYLEDYGNVDFYNEGTLVIDVLDGTTKELIWRGLGRKRINDYDTSEDVVNIIKKVVDKILENYPPQ